MSHTFQHPCHYRTSILNKNNEFLMIKDKIGRWDLPGGGLNFGETPQECIKRELKEEMGVKTLEIDTNPLYFFTSQTANKKAWFSNVIYRAKIKNLNFKQSDECIEVGFFTKTEALEKNIFPNVQTFLNLYTPEVKNHKTKT